ncbi:hypothetical protein [Paenibacillus andongensis]|uniref:hypothetical protein n=1 Tax=Paenibacillus andongensis TaxID=2975482 RepID=UPI0021BAF470|nr:hypothetical protein [Paenibacillus andongensis]
MKARTSSGRVIDGDRPFFSVWGERNLPLSAVYLFDLLETEKIRFDVVRDFDRTGSGDATVLS